MTKTLKTPSSAKSKPMPKSVSSILKRKIQSGKKEYGTPNKVKFATNIKKKPIIGPKSKVKKFSIPKHVSLSSVPSTMLHPAIKKDVAVLIDYNIKFCSVPHCENDTTTNMTYTLFPNDRERLVLYTNFNS